MKLEQTAAEAGVKTEEQDLETDTAADSKPTTQVELSLRPWAEKEEAILKEETAVKEEAVGVKSEADDLKGPPMPEIVIKAEAEKQPEEAAQAGPHTAEQAQLSSILGDEITAEQAEQLLKRSGGDMQKALNAFYDGSASLRRPDTANPPRPQPTARVGSNQDASQASHSPLYCLNSSS